MMKKFLLHIHTLLLLICISSCSSDDEPIAEVFRGKWNIYEQKDQSGQTKQVEGELSIQFGDNSVIFNLNVEDADFPIVLSGIVWENKLHESKLRQVTYASLFTEDGVLRIEYSYEGVGYTYYAGFGGY